MPTAPPDEKMIPKIQVRQRHTLADLSMDEKIRERDRLITRVEAKTVDFKDLSEEMLPQSADMILRNIVEVIEFYPELQVTVMGHVSQNERKKRKAPQAEKLASARAELCARMLTDLGLLNEIRHFGVPPDAANDKPLGCCIVRLEPGPLLEPQQRVDLILQRWSFDFKPKTAEISEKGMKVVNVLGRIIKEAQHSAHLDIPRTSSELAISRAHKIADAMRATGATKPIEVLVARGDIDRATLTIDRVDRPEPVVDPRVEHPVVMQAAPVQEEQMYSSTPRQQVWDPQSRLIEILKETPLAFRQNGTDLVPDVLPVVRKIADVLKGVHDMVCLVEAFSGPARAGRSAATGGKVMKERAERIVDHLHAEGVKLPCRAVGYSGAYSHLGVPCTGPCIVITLVHPGDEENGVIEEDEKGPFVCGESGDVLARCMPKRKASPVGRFA